MANLDDFSRYPTLPVGLIVAVPRRPDPAPARRQAWRPGGPGDRDVILQYALEMLDQRPDVVGICPSKMHDPIPVIYDRFMRPEWP